MRGLLELRPAFAGLRRLSRRFPLARQGAQALLPRTAREAFQPCLRRPTATRICTNGARACSIIGGRCSCSPRAGRRSFRRGSRPPRSLSQILGDDHDISLLMRLVSTPTMMFGSPDETAAFLKRCRKRHRTLRKEARKLKAERLFAERSRPFAERIESLLADRCRRRRQGRRRKAARQCRGLRRCAHRRAG